MFDTRYAAISDEHTLNDLQDAHNSLGYCSVMGVVKGGWNGEHVFVAG